MTTHLTKMTDFDFTAPAELFASRGTRTSGNAMRYRRFLTGAEAVRYAIEDLDEALLQGAVIECGDVRVSGSQIRGLYDSVAYPLR
jgi:hypothetical protein